MRHANVQCCNKNTDTAYGKTKTFSFKKNHSRTQIVEELEMKNIKPASIFIGCLKNCDNYIFV